jgi:predicted metal-binding membrane protein
MEMAMGIVAQGPAAVGAAGAMAGMGDMAASGMAGVAETGWSVAGLAAFVTTWAVMMAAMMLPAVTPLLLLYRTVAGGRQSDTAAFGSTWVLAAGYLLVWAAIGLATYAIVHIGAEAVRRLGVEAHDRWAAVALGATLIVAGLYQFTPLKRACLRQCQSPYGFVMGHWRDGWWGALRMGTLHGAYCLGCCWALFAVLVAAGVMSLAWMLLLTLVIFAEKVFPYGQRAAVAVGLAFVALGVLVASGAIGMPWAA